MQSRESVLLKPGGRIKYYLHHILDPCFTVTPPDKGRVHFLPTIFLENLSSQNIHGKKSRSTFKYKFEQNQYSQPLLYIPSNIFGAYSSSNRKMRCGDPRTPDRKSSNISKNFGLLAKSKNFSRMLNFSEI